MSLVFAGALAEADDLIDEDDNPRELASGLVNLLYAAHVGYCGIIDDDPIEAWKRFALAMARTP